MDNPQHYQPLSHALHPPQSTQQQQQQQQQYQMYDPNNPAPANGVRAIPQEEEDDEDNEDDEGLVEEQLNERENEQDAQEAGGSSVKARKKGCVGFKPARSLVRLPHPAHNSPSAGKTAAATEEQDQPERKRRPGRPRGSKNRKARVIGESTIKPLGHTAFYSYTHHPPLHPTGPGTAPPALPEVNPQNQGYYEFQWRVLNMCAEFYGAAEELVVSVAWLSSSLLSPERMLQKKTPPLVLAQCYTAGASKVDPLAMLNEGKRNCDILVSRHLFPTTRFPALTR
jgi:hypothetical protein